MFYHDRDSQLAVILASQRSLALSGDIFHTHDGRVGMQTASVWMPINFLEEVGRSHSKGLAGCNVISAEVEKLPKNRILCRYNMGDFL